MEHEPELALESILLPLDPWAVRKHARLHPVRLYVTLRRVMEPYWYRAAWEHAPWDAFRPQTGDLPLSSADRELLQALERVPSAVTAPQAAALLHFARHTTGEGDFVEIGADHGKSAILLGTAAAQANPPCRLHSVDPFPSRQAIPDPQRMGVFAANLRRFSIDNVQSHACSGGEYRARASRPVRFVFVDAAHDYLNTRFDFLAWKPLVVRGGFLAAHDVDNPQYGPGTRRAFLKHILSDPEWTLRYHTDNLAIAQRMTA